MPMIIALDYGLKRCGIATTDELQMIAFGLTAIETQNTLNFIMEYVGKNEVEKIIIGLPLDLKGNLNEIEVQIQKFITQLQTRIPTISIERIDERFTSKMAEKSMVQTMNKKKDRQNKFSVDEISATLILQTYLEKKNFTL